MQCIRALAVIMVVCWLVGCGGNGGSAATGVDPCPSAVVAVSASVSCGAAGGERFRGECATVRAATPAACLPSFDALVQCTAAAPTCSGTGSVQRASACDPSLSAFMTCTQTHAADAATD